jgi:hypothetical protein
MEDPKESRMKPAHLFSIIAQVLVLLAGLSSDLPNAHAAAPSGSLIVNGSFEDPVIAGSFQLFSSIPGWGPTGSCGPGIEIDRNAFGAAAEGNQSVELNTTCVNGVSQVVATTPGASYSLAFAFAARPGTTAAQNRMDVRFDGLDVDELGPRAPGAGLQWSVHQVEVTATGSSATLSFQGSDPTAGDGAGTELDFVSLVPLVLHADPLTEIPESFYLNEVVCPSPSVCIVRGFQPSFSGATLTVVTDGIAGPTQIIPDTTLRGMTCFSPTSCFAVGSNNGEGVLVPITNGVVGPLQAVPGTVRLSDVTCASATSCVATGYYYLDAFPATAAVVVPITNGIAGPPQSVPGVGVLPRVSCPSATSCFATGRSTDNQGVLVPITNGVAGPAQVVAGTDDLVDIACPSPGTCVAISFDGSVVAITGGTAGPAQLISPDVILSSIACTDASHCVAVGGADIPGVGFEGAVVAIADGVAGPYQTVPGTDVLQTVACFTSCVAVGTDSSHNFGAIVPISGGVPGSAQYADGAGLLWDVACGAEGCIAVGGHPSPSVGGFVAIRPAAPPPPDCANATASPNLLWPPNHEFVSIQISGIVNPAPGAVTITVTSIFQDEPVQSSGSGNTSPDATGVGTGNPAVRAERDGGNDGRVYHIAFTAAGASGSCTGAVTVGVPKSQDNNGGPVDQGALYNSTLP